MAALIRIFKALLFLAVLLVVVAGFMIAFSWAPDKAAEELIGRWAPPPSTFVDVKGLKVHMRDEGPRNDPAPLVLIHGTSASLHTWEGWVNALKTRRRVITMDLPGFGLTGPNARNDYSSDAYRQFILDLLDTLSVQRCVLGGNSLGGDIAWHVAVASPSRVERLILVDSAGYPLTSQSMPIVFTIANTPVLNQLILYTQPRGMVASSLRSVYGDPARVTPQLVDRYDQLTLRQGNRRALLRRFQQMDFGAQAGLIKTIRQPTLILWGGRDKLIPPDDARRFQSDIANSRLVIFDGLGHVPQEEDPDRTAAEVISFLGQ